MTRVLVSTSSFGSVSRDPLDRLEAAGLECRLNPHGRRLEPAETVRLLAGCAGLIAGTEALDRQVLAAATDLRAISRCGSGAENIDREAAAELGITIRTTAAGHADAVAELALGGILCLLRHVAASDRGVRTGAWKKRMGHLLRGRTVGLIGLGRVGRRLAELLGPFEVTLLAHDEAPDPGLAPVLGVRYVELERLLSAADVVSLHLPLSERTQHLLDQRRLATMRRGALLVNCARGGLVDEEALGAALADGRLAGAYLDTFEREPYDGPLARLENVLLTPHIGSYAAEARLAMENEAVANLLAALAGDSG